MVEVKVLVVQLCPPLCHPMDYSLPGSSIPGILQARIVEWVAIHFSRGIFPTQGSNPRFLHWQADSLPLSHLGSPTVLYHGPEKNGIALDGKLVIVQSLKSCLCFATPWTITCTPLSMGFPTKMPGVGCHFLLQVGHLQMALLSTQCNSTMRLRAVFYISAERTKICRAKVLRHAFTGCFKELIMND